LIVPDALVDTFRTAIRITGHVPPPAIQAALADFMEEGHYGTHVRRMRAVYAARRICLIEAIATELDEYLEAAPGDGGMQMAAWLRAGTDDRRIADAAKRANVHVGTLAAYYLGDMRRPGVYLGFAAVPEAQIVKAARRLGPALREMPPRHT
jgi:GntR family transcriptional regulator/MocR family aminotransferase